MIPLRQSSLLMKNLYLLVLAMTISPAAAFSLVGNRNEFRLRTKSTRIHEVPRAFGVDPTNSFSFRINYRNGNEEDLHHHQQQKVMSTASLSSTLRPSSSFHENDQDTSKKVDEYLEFLDKRYNRMRGIDGPQSNKKPFSVLKWLAHEDHTEPPAEKEDALYALGVAGLASERLLQKHGIVQTAASSNNDESIVVEYSSSSETSVEGRLSLLLNKIFATFAAKVVSLQRQIVAKRNVMLHTVAQKLQTTGKAAMASLPQAASDFVRAVVKAGGGERNLKIAATTMCAFAIYFAQPLIKGAITARTQV